MVSPHRSRTATRALPSWLLEILACPVCSGALSLRDALLVCARCGHGYATQPHVDLLTPGKRPPNEGPGDTVEMARRRMAWERRMPPTSGERAAIEQYLDVIVSRLRPGAVVLDLGCGTGAVLRDVGRRVTGPLALLGLDISRPMLDASYRTLRGEPRAVVARASTRRRLPLRDASIDVVLRRLAPALPEEVSRVLRPGGAYVTASFGPAHWRELYDALPDLPRPKPDRRRAREALLGHGFATVEDDSRCGVERTTPRDTLDRLLMGPAAFHVDPARDLARLEALADSQGTTGQITLTTDAAITVVGAQRADSRAD